MMKKFPFEDEALKKWFHAFRRDLPWRKTANPYAIWVSEIMLQQTQVSVVEEYYLRWMSRFPKIADLAAAPIEEVLKMWEGLGYYSRARNLHEAARFLTENYDGELPSTKEQLSKVKGMGPYTIGAVLSFAFHQKAAAVDGNTIRVLTRYYGIEEDISKSSTLKKIWEVAEEILPENEPWVVVEGLIELGAMVCKKDPICSKCPLHKSCFAFCQGRTAAFPKKKKRIEIIPLLRKVFVILYGEEILVKKANPGKIMADLYEFPYFEWALGSEEGFPFPFTSEKLKDLEVVEHSFTRFRARLYPTLWKALEKIEVPEYVWLPVERIKMVPFSSGHKKVLNQLK